MVADTTLIKFLFLLSLLFFVPRLTERWVPHPITEVLLGILLGIFAPSYFAHDDIVAVLSALGIITLFVYAGLEANPEFIRKHKRVFIENLLISFGLFVLIGFIVYATQLFTLQVALLISLALTTPSASFIVSVTKELGHQERQWIEGKALAAEIAGIIVMAVLLGLSDWKQFAIAVGALAALLVVLPWLLRSLYKAVFSKLIGTEFSFILVVAFIAAFVTELVGLHFLVGAFFAGLVAKRFITSVARDPSYKLTQQRAQEVIEGFGHFAATFAPFFFFSTGMGITLNVLSWTGAALAIAAVILVGSARAVATALHRRLRIAERKSATASISMLLLPTLVFTFVIAEILYSTKMISPLVFGVLMLYGLLTSVLPVLLLKLQSRKLLNRG